MTTAREVFCVKGVWGYEQLARLGLSDRQLLLVSVGTSVLLHLLLLAVWGREPMGRMNIHAGIMLLPTGLQSRSAFRQTR